MLFVGDVVGKPGRAGLALAMPGLRERYAPDLCVVNGENSAGGLGITERTANDLFGMGFEVITLGAPAASIEGGQAAPSASPSAGGQSLVEEEAEDLGLRQAQRRRGRVLADDLGE